MSKKNLLDVYYFTLIGISLIMLLFSFQTTVTLRFIFFVISWLPLFVNKYANKYYVPSVFLYSLVVNDNLMEGVTFLPSSYSYLYYILALIVILFLYFNVYKNKIILGRKYILFVIVCFYFSVIDLLNTGEIGRYALLFMYIILIFPFLSNKKVIYYLLITYVLIAVKLSILLFVFKDKFAQNFSGMERYSWIDPNYFASTIGIGFTIAILFVLRYLELKNLLVNRKILIVILFLSLSTIILSASRGAIVGVSFILIVTLLYSKLKVYQKVLFVFVISTILVSLTMFGYFDIIIYRFFEEDSLNTGSYRTLIWNQILNAFFELPFHLQLFGSGYEHTMVLSNGMLAHNEYIELLSDYGYVGLGLVLSIIMHSLKMKKLIMSSSSILLIYFLIISLTLNPLRTVAFTMLLLVIFKLNALNNNDYLTKTIVKNKEITRFFENN